MHRNCHDPVPAGLDAGPSEETDAFAITTGETGALDSLSGGPPVPESEPRDPTRVPTSPLPSLARGTLIDHYRVVRLVGRGGMGEVYLARDTRLGRRVALKVVHRRRIGSSEAIARFLFEARTTARFSHPHIVAIHGVGEHEGQPYLALEYLEGRTLRARLRESRPTLREGARAGLAVAEALAEAHANGVLHRDLKPDNVFLPSDGRIRVVDFGLARVRSQDDGGTERWQGASAEYDPEQRPEERAAVYGTPSYMAPELWFGHNATGAADVWALGMILHELFTDQHPYRKRGEGPPRAAEVCSPRPVPLAAELALVPEPLRELVRGCLDKKPERRPSAAEVARGVGDWLDPPRHDSGAPVSPYPGLAAFDERHAHLYFGRRGEIAAFVERVRTEAILPVVGPSGSGKTSFVQAGVLPRLREQGRWRILRMRPGPRPFLTLARRLIAADVAEGATDEAALEEDSEDAATSQDHTAEYGGSTARSGPSNISLGPQERPLDETLGDDPEGLASRLSMYPDTLNLALQRIADRAEAPVLLIVDQLEEIHTQVEDDRIRRAFMQAVCTAADDPDVPVRVLLTLRDDFLGRLAYGAEVRDVLGRVTVMRKLDEEALLEVLVQPLHQVDHRFDDPSLAEQMVREVRGEPAALSMLQFSARTLWERRDTTRRLLRREAFDSLGGVAGAMAAHADGVLEGLNPSELRAAREILLRLVSPERTRRSVSTRAALLDLGPDGERALDRLTNSRLISVRKGLEDEHPQLELVHDSLIHTWLQLAEWVEESSEERQRQHRQLQRERRRRRRINTAMLVVLAVIALVSMVTAAGLAVRLADARARASDAEAACAEPPDDQGRGPSDH
jgi:eukaryotic-like serine/threonine-protein kinase